MKRSFFVLSLALVSIASASQEGVLLRRALKEGAKDVYLMTMKSKNAISGGPMGDMDFSVDGTMKMTYLFGKVDAEKKLADITLTVSDINMKLGGGSAPMAEGMMGQMPKEIKVEGKMDEFGNIKESKMSGQSMQMQMMTSGGFSGTGIIFPEKAVKVGDSWDMKLPKNPMFGNKEQTIPAKIVGEKDIDGVACYELSYDGSIPVDMDLSKIAEESGAPGGMEMTMKGTAKIKGTAQVDKVTGRLVMSDTTMNSKMKLDISAAGMTLDMNGDVQTVIKLQK